MITNPGLDRCRGIMVADILIKSLEKKVGQTSNELTNNTSLKKYQVMAGLRYLRREKKIGRKTDWKNKHAYTWRYYLNGGGNADSSHP